MMHANARNQRRELDSFLYRFLYRLPFVFCSVFSRFHFIYDCNFRLLYLFSFEQRQIDEETIGAVPTKCCRMVICCVRVWISCSVFELQNEH